MQIPMEVKGLQSFKLKVNIREALSWISKQSNHIEREDNLIRFVLSELEVIEFHRIFIDNWSMKILSQNLSRTITYLNTNTVKVIIINLYYGNLIQDTRSNRDIQHGKQKETEFNLQKISDYVDKNLKCYYCHHRMQGVDQEHCGYCGTEYDLTRFLYQFIFAKE